MTISMDDVYHLIENENAEMIEQRCAEDRPTFDITFKDFENALRRETGCCTQTVRNKWDQAVVDSVLFPYGVRKYRSAHVVIDTLAVKTNNKKIKKKIKKNIFAIEEARA